MRAIYHCVWNHNEEDEAFLKQQGVQYEWYRETSYSWLIVDIDETDPACPKVLEMAKNNLHFRYFTYTRNDLDTAEYLTVRAKNMSFALDRENELFELSEMISPGQYRHQRFINSDLHIKKPVKWGQRHIKATFTLSEAHLFCDDHAAVFFSGYADLTMQTVYHARTEEAVQNVHYIQFNRVLPLEAICFDREESYICPVCGSKTWLIKPDHQLVLMRDKLPKELTFAKTQDIWGSGGCYSYPLNIISQDAFRAMNQAGLAQKNLVFEPVVLV